VAFPFYPMTNEMLKKISRAIRDSDRTINSLDSPAVFETQYLKSILELSSQHSEANPSASEENHNHLRT
jgi:hypothetical protein